MNQVQEKKYGIIHMRKFLHINTPKERERDINTLLLALITASTQCSFLIIVCLTFVMCVGCCHLSVVQSNMYKYSIRSEKKT